MTLVIDEPFQFRVYYNFFIYYFQLAMAINLLT